MASQTHKENGYDVVDVIAVFIIAERTIAGPYETSYGWFHSGSENTLETQDLVDAQDLDGDGSLEVVTQFGYSEAVEYHVYKKLRDRKTDVYKQFGAGC